MKLEIVRARVRLHVHSPIFEFKDGVKLFKLVHCSHFIPIRVHHAFGLINPMVIFILIKLRYFMVPNMTLCGVTWSLVLNRVRLEEQKLKNETLSK